MRSYEFWRRRGGVWAVELENGIVVGCCGPLDASDVDERFLDALAYTARDAAWVESHRNEFELFQPSMPYGQAGGGSR